MPPASQQPDWEVPRNYHTQASIPPMEEIYTDKQHSRGFKTTAVELLDKTIPPHRTYLGLRRRYFLSTLAAAIILVILAIGLGVGLDSHSGYVPHSSNQPLSLTQPPVAKTSPSQPTPKPSPATSHTTPPPSAPAASPPPTATTSAPSAISSSTQRPRARIRTPIRFAVLRSELRGSIRR